MKNPLNWMDTSHCVNNNFDCSCCGAKTKKNNNKKSHLLSSRFCFVLFCLRFLISENCSIWPLRLDDSRPLSNNNNNKNNSNNIFWVVWEQQDVKLAPKVSHSLSWFLCFFSPTNHKERERNRFNDIFTSSVFPILILKLNFKLTPYRVHTEYTHVLREDLTYSRHHPLPNLTLICP